MNRLFTAPSKIGHSSRENPRRRAGGLSAFCVRRRRRAQLTAGLLQAVETALAEVYEMAPLASQIVPFPGPPQTDLEVMARGFRGNRGKVLIRESVNVARRAGRCRRWTGNRRI